MTHTKRTTSVLGGILAAAILALTACGGGGDDSDGKATAEESAAGNESGAPAAPEPDLEGIPDVVAEVNGQDVTKDEFVAVYTSQFQQAAMQAQMSGEEPDEDALKRETAENLVGTELLRQEADERGIEASAKQVDDTLADLAEQNQLSTKKFLAALEEQGTSEELARHQVETQIVVEGLVEDEIGSTEPTDRELRKRYDAAVRQQEEAAKQGGQEQSVPPFAKVRSQLAEQARSEKQGKAAQALVEQLRKDADVTINV